MTDVPEQIAVCALHEEMRRVRSSRVPTSRWYIFGSVRATKRPISDIDLLVVCETAAACTSVRVELAPICAQYPIHLLLMTTREEAEANFIQGQGAAEITCND
jgi:predicted nucleotidyltransferase